ncbi:MAG: site-specific integrase [Lentisphaerae bacterium]|nr:site-specific integrase [Lentisphaerota bacterium]
MDNKPSIGIGSIYLDSRKGRYYFAYPKGGITAKSLKTSDPEEAVREARKRFGYLVNGERAEALAEAVVRMKSDTEVVGDATRPRINLDESELYNSYLAVLQRANLGRDRHEDASSKSPLATKTLKEVKGYIRRFCQWIKDNHSNVKTMDQVTVVIADTYLEHIRSQFSANTYNHYITNLRVIWKRLAVKAGLDSNVWATFEQLHNKQVNAEKISKRPFSLDQLKLVMDKADEVGGWFPVATHIGYETGMRLGDVVTLKLDEIDTAEAIIEKRTRKGGKNKTLYIPESMPYITTWIENKNTDGEYLFPELASYQLGINRKQDDSEVAGRFSAFLRDDCEIVTTVTDDNGKARTVLGFHSLRVANATYSRSSGASITEVQGQLGHGSIKTTGDYIQEDQEIIRARAKASYRPLPNSKLSTLEIIKQGLSDLSKDEKAALMEFLAKS